MSASDHPEAEALRALNNAIESLHFCRSGVTQPLYYGGQMTASTHAHLGALLKTAQDALQNITPATDPFKISRNKEPAA